MFKVRLPLFEMDGDIGAESTGVESVPAAEVQTETVDESQTGVDTQAAAEPEKQNNFEKAFAKRLAAEREKWQSEVSEKYKDYDTHKELSNYFQQINGVDAMTLKERIEYEKLQEKAEANNISPEMQRRLETLEAKAAKADQLEWQQQQEQVEKTYFSALGDFVKDKGVSPDELNKFMIENELTYNPNDMTKSFNIALKAMKAEQFEKQAKEKESETISRYLASKSSTKVEGSTGAASTQSVDTSKMSWKEIERHAVARLEASKTPQ